MGNFKINIWVIAAIVAIIGIGYFTFQAIQQENYSGSEVAFTSTGIITIENPSEDPVMVTATSRRTFNIATSDTTTRTMPPTREGTGSAARYVASAEFPGSQVEINVTRGTDVEFAIAGGEGVSLDVTVAARSAEDNRNLVIMSVIGVLALLVFISFQTEHFLLGAIHNQFSPSAKGTDVGTASV